MLRAVVSFFHSTSGSSTTSERTLIAAGVCAGLLIGAVLLHRGSSADDRVTKETASVVTPPVPAVAVPAVPPTPTIVDPETEALQRRIAELEKQKLERRMAALEAELSAAAVEAEPPPRRAVSSSSPRLIAADTSPPRASSPPAVAAGPATLAYWNALNDVIAKETAMRAAPGKVTAANAGGFVESRIQAGEFASSAITKLDTAGVDADAVALGGELAAWYREEVTLNEQAKSLLGSQDVAARKGAPGKSWKSGEEQHRRKCDEINRRGADLQSRLSRKYGLAFPPLK